MQTPNRLADGTKLLILIPLMPVCRDFRLLFEYLVADGAVLPLGQAALRASCGNALLRNDRMPCGDRFQPFQDGIADRTVLAFRLSVRRAGRRDRFIDYFRVSLCGNYLLLDQHGFAGGAMTSLGQAALRASRRNRRVGHDTLMRRRDYLLRNDDSAADRTVRTLRFSVFKAGLLSPFVNDFRMRKQVDYEFLF